MTTAIQTNETSKQVARPLRVLVPLIKEDLKLEKAVAAQATMEIKRSIGNKMVEARSQMSLSETHAWTKRNFDLGRTQTNLYISFADATPDPSAGREEYTSLKDFRRRHLGQHPSGPRPPSWQEPVKETIELAKRQAERIETANLSRAREREELRKLCLRIIDIGFKVLSKEFHSDKGGSDEAMARLNRARAHLKASA